MAGRPGARRLWRSPLVMALPALAAAVWWASGPAAAAPAAEEPASGSELYATQCVSCHGVDGAGVAARGPSLQGEGRAAADFVLRTGRMPLADPALEARRGPVRYSEDELVALVDYVGSLGDGPDIPTVDQVAGDEVSGGDLYRLNCAACHVASGSGAVIGANRRAPSLMDATPVQVGEAVAVGPGAMPVFDSLTPDEVDDLAAYVGDLQHRSTTGAGNLGGVGPVAEGLAAWLLALVPLVAVSRWIGRPSESVEPSQPDTGANR